MIGDAIGAQMLSGLVVAAAGTLLGLLSLWAATSRRHWFVRFCVLAAVLGLGLPIAAYDLILTVFIGSVLIFLVTVVGRLVARRRNLTAPMWERLRFSTADLLLSMVAVAVVLAMTVKVRYLSWSSWSDILIAAMAFAAITLLSAWVVTGKARLWQRLLAAAIVCPAVGASMVRSRLLHADTGPGDLLGYLDYLRIFAQWCSPTAAAHCALLIVAIALARRGNWSPRSIDESPRHAASAGPTILLGGLVMCMLLPLGASYYKLLTPPPIPVENPPQPNAFDRLSLLGQRLDMTAKVPDADTATHAELKAFVSANAVALSEVHAALTLPFDLPVSYTSLGDVTSYASDLREIARALYAEGRFAELEGRTDDAVASYTDGVHLGRAILGDGLAIHYLVGIAVDDFGAAGLRRIRNSLNCAQSRALLAKIEQQFQPHTSPEPHLRREQIWEQHALEWQGRLAAILRAFAGEEPSIRKPLVDAHTRDQTLLNLLCTELALRCFQCDRGRLPTTLSELTPEHLPAVLDDPFSGGPLIYRPEGTVFKLYSVGPDLLDDGGKLASFLGASGDIVLSPPPTVPLAE